MVTELKIQQMTIDGLPHLCPECDTASFTLDGRGFSDGFPARGNCSNYHSWESLFLTIGDLKEIQAASTGRERAEDVDTFEIEVGGAVLAGILHPDVIVDDLKRAVRDVYWKRLIKPALRRQKRKALRAAKKPVSNAVAAAKAGAIGAAWGLQAGGHQPDPDYTPEPINACPACSGKGSFDLESNIHGNRRIPCTVCTGTGEID
jgi:hypothetical protein